jgi:Na+-transporting methylmalonyl-CoA/oxaloacetate decarboxylase gamma subunit
MKNDTFVEFCIEQALKQLETAMERSSETADMVCVDKEYKANAQLGSLKVIIAEAVHYLKKAKEDA